MEENGRTNICTPPKAGSNARRQELLEQTRASQSAAKRLQEAESARLGPSGMRQLRVPKSVGIESGTPPPPQWDFLTHVLPPFHLDLLTQVLPPAPAPRLVDMGINVRSLIPGVPPTTLRKYQFIVDAFSTCFYPGLFSQLGLRDPYWGWPYDEIYWDTLFAQLQPQGFPVDVDRGASPICFGQTGQTDGTTYISIYDCSGADDIVHEIGHVVMEGGILQLRQPLYYHYTAYNGNVLDARDDLLRLFGGPLDRRTDSDGVSLGFITDYAQTNEKEDFAETYKYFVYYPTELWAKVSNQEKLGSSRLSNKALYVAGLFHNLWFAEHGKVGGWLGYPID